MVSRAVIRDPAQLSVEWLSHVLGEEVTGFDVITGHGNWSHQYSIQARVADGATRALRLKICLGPTFGRSEVDYYLRDYVGLPDAPLVRCHDALHDPDVGYHLLLDDLGATHHDRRDEPPTLAYGIAVARLLGRMHANHWQRQPAPAEQVMNRYFDEIRPGVPAIEAATGQRLREQFGRHEETLRRRWAQGHGMSLLHGDLNPTNVLSAMGSDASLYFIDRQPFDWSLTYGVAVYDLAYFMIPWWPEDMRCACELPVLRQWFETLNQPDYSWQMALVDWQLSVEQCLHVPIEWCSKPDTLERMRWLWQMQFVRIRDAMASPAVHQT